MTDTQPPFALHLAEHSEVIEFLDHDLVDELIIHEIGKELLELIGHRHDSFLLVLDFHQVEHLSSSMLGLVITLHSAALRQGGEVALVGLSDSMLEVLQIMRLTEVLRICETASEALRKSA